ncbi:MAG: molybdenum cofactor synthesis protein [Bacteroidetes bacterium]|nr:molybdenum cofactor synthesis protein [Bacteroidota bacterium]
MAFDTANGKVISLNISEEKGVIKTPRDTIELNELGIIDDAHRGRWHRQISLLAQEDIDGFSEKDASGRKFLPGEFAENITTQGIDFKEISILDRIKFGEVELEISQIGKMCHGDGCAIYVEVGKCVMPKSGIFARVIKGGTISKDSELVYHPRPLKIKVITLSDRASAGEYQDQSGPAITQKLVNFFSGKRWHTEFSSVIISDDKAQLKNELEKCESDNIDIIFTTGGTGIGPRDITPDVILDFAANEIPGIMDYIRMKYGEKIPSALLSRSVAAFKGTTLIFALPGSVKAVKEYTEEITRVLEHTLLMVHGLGH